MTDKVKVKERAAVRTDGGVVYVREGSEITLPASGVLVIAPNGTRAACMNYQKCANMNISTFEVLLVAID